LLFPQNNDISQEYCWISAQKTDREHPQIQAVAGLIKSIFNRDILREGVDPALRLAPTDSSVTEQDNTDGNSFLKNRINQFYSWLTSKYQTKNGQEGEVFLEEE